MACLVGNGAMVGGGARHECITKKHEARARRAMNRGVAAGGVAAGELRARVT